MIEVLTIVFPALLVLLTAYLLIDKLLRNEEKRRKFEFSMKNQSIITPIRLRAYERLVLLLERTSPSWLILNVAKPHMTNMELQTQLLASIRQEFNHNLSQQIYVSKEAWLFVRTAQESLLRLVNTCSASCNPADSATVLAEMLIQVFSESEQTPTEMALEKLKNEVKQYFQ